MNDVLFSIIIPAYNAETYLSACLDSILSQGRDDIEVIIVDDGSTDATPAICSDYETRFPGCVSALHITNDGPLIGRVSGFRQAQGRYLLAVDSDDLLMPGALDALASLVEATNADIVLFGYTKNYEDYEAALSKGTVPIFDDYICPQKQEVIQQLCGGYELNFMWSKLVKRECAALDFDYSPYAGSITNEDFFQSVLVVDEAQSFCQTNQVLYYYRVHVGSTMQSSFKPEAARDSLKFLDAATPYAQKWEQEFSIEGPVRGLAHKGLITIKNYALSLAAQGNVVELARLRASDAFVSRRAVPGAKDGLAADDAAALWFFEHRWWHALRVEVASKVVAKRALARLKRS